MIKQFKKIAYAVGFIPIILFAIPVGLLYGLLCVPKTFSDTWKRENVKLKAKRLAGLRDATDADTGGAG